MEAVMPRQETGFATRLRALRAAAGLTLAELASRSGLHLGSIAKLERAEREPAWPTVLALASALGVPITAFLPAEADDDTHTDDAPDEPPAAPPAPRGKMR